MKKDKIFAYLLSIVIGQIIALIFWFFFDQGAINFLSMLGGSIAGVYVGYTEPNKTSPHAKKM